MQGDIRMLLLERLQTRDEPTRGERRQDCDVEARAVAGLPHQILTVTLQPVECLADLERITLSIRQKPDTITDPLEQRDAEEGFQPAYLPTDRSFG